MHIEKDDKKSSSKDKDKKSTSKDKDKKSDKSGGTPKKGADKGASDKKSSKSKKEGSPAGKNAFELQLLNEASKADLNEEAKSQKSGGGEAKPTGDQPPQSTLPPTDPLLTGLPGVPGQQPP